jgi:hypothetical protein
MLKGVQCVYAHIKLGSSLSHPTVPSTFTISPSHLPSHIVLLNKLATLASGGEVGSIFMVVADFVCMLIATEKGWPY